jgi:stearoyl-CoA desaturase (delta-9 desaturase)
MLYGFLNLSVWGYIGAALVLTHMTIASVTIFLHRHQAHHSLTLHPIASHLFRLWLWLTTGIVTREWVAVHRKHHAKCETADDPHSPQIKGIWNVLFRGAGLYRAAKRDAGTLARFGKGTPDDWLERQVYGRLPYLGLSIMASLDLLLFGAAGLVVFAVQMVWIPFWAAGVVNGLAHFWGYRNFETKDASHNLSPFGLLIGGEELHNNHHAYPQSARLSSKWWEVDLGWLYIRTLVLLRLACVRRVAPKLVVARKKQQVDADTLRAVLHGRQHIFTLYDRNVIRPTVRSERRTGAGTRCKVPRHVRKLMAREDIELDRPACETLDSVLRQSPLLETVYRYKTHLRELWTDPDRDRTKRLKCLQDWCAEAERSGIKALEDFVRVLRSCTLQSA